MFKEWQRYPKQVDAARENKNGRPGVGLKDGIRGTIADRGLEGGKWMDRQEWRLIIGKLQRH